MKIITVTLNPCIDVAYNMKGEFRAGELNRVGEPKLSFSGKGINVSRRLLSLGTQSTVITFSFGEDGRKMCESLRREGMSVYAVECEGRLRRNSAILDEKGNATEMNESGSVVSEEKQKELIGLIKSELNCPDKKILMVCGSIPAGCSPDIYRKICKIGAMYESLVVLDCDGEALKAGLKSNPNLIKPNRRELEELTGADLSATGEDVRIDAVRCALEFYRNEDVAILATLDCDGAVYAGPDGSFMCPAVKGNIKSFKGAGDAFLASFIRELIVLDGECEISLVKAAAQTTELLCKNV